MPIYQQGDLFPDYTPAPVATAEEILSAINGHREALCRCWSGAWSDWHTHVNDDGRILLGALSRAVCMNDFAKKRAAAEFSQFPDIVCDTSFGFFKLIFGNKAVARFKKINREFVAMNTDTEQQKAWYRNEPFSGIPSSCCRITIGCLLSPTGDAIDDIRISHQVSHKTVVWSRSLLDDAGTIPLPFGFNPNIGPTPIPLIPLDGESLEEAM